MRHLFTLGWFGLLCLFLSGCQPYPDHDKPIPDFRVNSVDFGSKRALKIAKFQGDRKGLRLEFNQPLKGWTLEGRKPSFRLSFEPEIASASVTRVGAATVEVKFATPLPLGQTYSVTVPSGWRALTGASFMGQETFTWKTENPESVESRPPEPAARLSLEQYPSVWTAQEPSIRLRFSHPVEVEELRRHILGLSPESYTLRTSDGLNYVIERWNVEGSPESPTLTVLEGLTSLSGAVLATSLTIELDFGPKVELSKPLRRTVLLEARETVLPVPFPDNATAQTWSLSDKQLLRLLALPADEWSKPKKFAEELRTPVYRSTSKKGQLRTRFLDPEKTSPQSPGSGAFLLRVTKVDGSVARFLVQRTLLRVDGVALNARVHFFVGTTTAMAKKSQSVDVSLFSHSGQLLQQGREELGTVQELSGEWAETPRFVRVKWQDQTVICPLVAVEYRSLAPLAATVWTDRTVYRPGQRISYQGLWWALEPRGNVKILDSEGVFVTTLTNAGQSVGPAYQGTVAAPLTPGQYTLLVGPPHTDPIGCRFAVSEMEQKPNFDFRLLSRPQAALGEHQGRYEWEGPRADQLVVRARLSPLKEATNGWSRVWPTEPNWEPVEVNQAHTLEGGKFGISQVPKRQGRSLLSVHLTDRRNPSVVLAEDSRLWGEADVTLDKADLTTLAGGAEQALFRWKFHDPLLGASDTVDCRLSRYQDGRWISLSEGRALWQDGAWLWTSNISGDGHFRCSVSWDKGDVRQTAHWAYSVTPDRLREYPRLFERSKLWRVNEQLDVNWNGSDEVGPVWLFSGIEHPEVKVWRRRLQSGDRFLASVKEPHAAHRKEVSFLALAPNGEKPSHDVALRFSKIPTVVEHANSRVAGEQALESLPVSTVEVGQTVELPVDQSTSGVYFYGWRAKTSSTVSETLLNLWNRKARAPLQSVLNLTLHGPQKIDTNKPHSVEAPSRPGEYVLSMLVVDKEQQLKEWNQSFRVTEKAHWSIVMPPRIRAEDKFSAGIEFRSQPDGVMATGVTASVELDSDLLPNSYLATAILVKPTEVGRLLFHYTAPRFLAQKAGQKLHWELGVEGKIHTAEAEIPFLAPEVVSRVFRSQLLKSGEALQFSLSSLKLWRLSLERIAQGSEASHILVEGIADTPLSPHLNNEHDSWDYFGFGGPPVALRHERGAPVKVTLERLESVQEENRYRAESLYVLRLLRNWQQIAQQDDPLVAGERYLISYHVIAPSQSGPLVLQAPLPGTARVVGCWMSKEDSLRALSWRENEQGAEIDLPALDPGEHHVLLGFEAVVGGDYRWPRSRVLDAQGELQGQSLESRVKVENP